MSSNNSGNKINEEEAKASLANTTNNILQDNSTVAQQIDRCTGGLASGDVADFYKIAKSGSESSIDDGLAENATKERKQLPQKSPSNLKRVNSRCANLAPKNLMDGSTTSTSSARSTEHHLTAAELLLSEMNVQPRGVPICKKRVNAIENDPAGIGSSSMLNCSAAATASLSGIDALGWQGVQQTTRERLAYMLMNETMADVFFLFRDEKNGTVQKIPAHKFVLSIGSAVFEAMFRFNDSSQDGGCANCIREIELIDVEREAFEALLAFLYTDSIEAINKETVMSILYTAKKYAVPALENACIAFLETCLNSENAFMLLAKARFYDEERLAKQCLDIIDEEAHEALKSEDFLSIDHETLCIVLKRNTLQVKELTLFNAAKCWAMEACRLQGLMPSPENQRKMLGSALYLIRFPRMNPTDFAKHVAPTKLLNDAEMVSVFLFYHTGPEHPVPFSLSSRGLYTPEMVVNRFQRVESSWGYTGTPDRVKFMVDTPILILGFGLYGSNRDSCKYSVTIEILNFNNGKTLASHDDHFISDGSASIFRVMFEEPVEIAPNTTYIASANLTGHESHYGTKGLRKIKLERQGRADINWHFQYAPGNNNGTSVEDGQIPQIFFCAKQKSGSEAAVSNQK